MGKRFWIGLLLVSCFGAAGAGGPGAVRKQVESSLLLNGTIDLHADGSVAGYALDKPEAVPKGIAGVIAAAVPLWRFEPVRISGGATRVRAKMSLRLVAKKMDGGDFTVQIRGAGFGQDRPGEYVSGNEMRPPAYPPMAAQSGVAGTVYALLKIGRDGRVEEAVAEQVNLRVISNENGMARWRDVLGKAAVRAAKDWTFNPPTKGEEVDAPYWSARVPVDFRLSDESDAKYGQWEAYVPGPRQRGSWTYTDDNASSGPDALADGGVYPVGSGPRLLTALDPP